MSELTPLECLSADLGRLRTMLWHDLRTRISVSAWAGYLELLAGMERDVQALSAAGAAANPREYAANVPELRSELASAHRGAGVGGEEGGVMMEPMRVSLTVARRSPTPAQAAAWQKLIRLLLDDDPETAGSVLPFPPGPLTKLAPGCDALANTRKEP